MDASELFSFTPGQPSRMPPDITELPPLIQGCRIDMPTSCNGSPSRQSQRSSSGYSMRPVKEEKYYVEPECARGLFSLDGPADESADAVEFTSDCGSVDENPSTWGKFFEKCQDVRPREDCADTFRVYSSGSSGPVLFLLHGAGHTALSWACFTKMMRDCGMPLRVFAYDARAHGETKCVDEKDLSANILVEDGIKLVQTLFDGIVMEQANGHRNQQQQVTERHSQCKDLPSYSFGCGECVENIQQEEPLETDELCLPSVILVGHSMGGAIAARMAASGRIPQLEGLMVLDAVEGTALAALPQMAAFVSRFPSSFNSCKEAVNWSIFAGLLCNKASASISIPSQLVKTTRCCIPSSHSMQNRPADEQVWTWRMDLMSTECYWEGWFRGMSHAFLASPCVKILICSNSDRLDKELMIAHMQGKFQVQVVTGSGHVIEEDQPAELCRVVHTFITRYRLHLPPGKRVGIFTS